MSTSTPATVPSSGRLLWRGIRKKCPRCGRGKLFSRWFTMKDRCPRCGHLFDREEGFFLGAFVINFALVEGAVALFMLATIVDRANGGSYSRTPLIGAVAAAITVPFVFYPFSKTIWAAIDLALHRETYESDWRAGRS